MGIKLKKHERSSYSKGKIWSRGVLTFNEKGLFTKNEVFNAKQKLIGKVLWEYSGDSLVTTKHYNKKGSLKKTQTCHIAYY
jgi:hypothetical protein